MLEYIGSFYMVFLILLLIIGLGSTGLGFINYLFSSKNVKNNNKNLKMEGKYNAK